MVRTQKCAYSMESGQVWYHGDCSNSRFSSWSYGNVMGCVVHIQLAEQCLLSLLCQWRTTVESAGQGHDECETSSYTKIYNQHLNGNVKFDGSGRRTERRNEEHSLETHSQSHLVSVVSPAKDRDRGSTFRARLGVHARPGSEPVYEPMINLFNSSMHPRSGKVDLIRFHVCYTQPQTHAKQISAQELIRAKP